MRYQLARLLRAQGKLREAERSSRARSTRCRRTPKRRSSSRRCDARRARTDESLDLLIALLERDPYHFDALLALAETLLAIGRKRDAAHAIRRILRFDPDARRRAVLRRRPAHRPEAVPRGDRAVAPVIELDPSSEFARRARREARTAMDLDAIFAATAAAGV